MLEWVRPDPKCGHGRIRGTCTKCARGQTPAQRQVDGNITDFRFSVVRATGRERRRDKARSGR